MYIKRKLFHDLKSMRFFAKFKMLKYSEPPMIIEPNIFSFNFESEELCNFHFAVGGIC